MKFKRKGTGKNKVEILKKMIFLVDGYRIGRCEDFRWVNKTARREIGRKIYCKWEELEKILFKLARVPKDLPKIPNLVKIRMLIAYSSLIFPSMFLFLFFNQILFKKSLIIPSFVVMFFGGGAIITYLLVQILCLYIDYKISKMVSAYWNEHPEKYHLARLRLKSFVQFLIDELSNCEVNSESSRGHRISLFNVDYDGIKILKKPRAWRKFYLCEVQIKTKLGN